MNIPRLFQNDRDLIPLSRKIENSANSLILRFSRSFSSFLRVSADVLPDVLVDVLPDIRWLPIPIPVPYLLYIVFII